jgi:hypothetical protein
LFTGGAGNDQFTFSSTVTATSGFGAATSIVGGAGNDSIALNGAASTGSATYFGGTTYFFGTDSGNDTLSFGTTLTTVANNGLSIVAGSGFGATNTFTFSSATSLVSFGSGGSQRSIFITGTTGGTVDSIGTLGITFATVADVTITNFG